MAASLITGGKKTSYYVVSNGTRDINTESDWNPGHTTNKKRTGKDHKSRLEPRKARGHYGSGSA